jgi:hypothetical protein
MVSLAKLLRFRQGIEEKYKNIGLEKFRLSIVQLATLSCYRSFMNISQIKKKLNR